MMRKSGLVISENERTREEESDKKRRKEGDDERNGM
jgi:hypothetical protein